MKYAPSHYTSKEFQLKNGQQIIKGTINKQTRMWEVSLETLKKGVAENNILD